MTKSWWSGALVLLIACGPPVESRAPLEVTCDAPAPPDSTAVHVQLDAMALESGGRILLRIDSLDSPEGPVLKADSGFVVQAFATVGPGYGCATVAPGGAWVRGAEDVLSRSWIHVKSDRPVRLNVRAPSGEVVTTVGSKPGVAVDPITWEGVR